MEEQQPQIELYINAGTDEMNSTISQAISSVKLDFVVKHTLAEAGITQPVMLTLLITDDDTIRDLNKQYRQQNKPTDVLSFPLLDKPLVNAPADQLWMPREERNGEGEGQRAATEEKAPAFVTPPELITNLGDVVISWPTVLRQASAAAHDPTYELVYLLSHGVLHLVGYDDQNEAGYEAMVRIQQSVLQVMGWKA